MVAISQDALEVSVFDISGTISDFFPARLVAKEPLSTKKINQGPAEWKTTFFVKGVDPQNPVVYITAYP